MFTPATRTYIYGIVTAAMPLLISFGALTEGIAQQVALLVAAILGVTAPALAKANVPKPDTITITEPAPQPAPDMIATELPPQ